MGFLEKVASFQYEYAKQIVIISILLTFIIGLGASETRLDTDLTSAMPQDLDVVILSNEISDTFGAGEMILVLVELDSSCGVEDSVHDIRDPQVMNMLVGINDALSGETGVESVQSAGTIFSQMGYVPESIDSVKYVLDQVPALSGFFNADYTATMVMISADIGSSESQVNSFVSSVEEDLSSIVVPGCVKMTITGNAPIRSTMMGLLMHDLVYTMSLAAVTIFALLVLLRRSLSDAVLIFTPLLIGLIWMLGIMGWIGMPLAIATVGVGAMILGLGTEYGVFLLERYEEERKKGRSQKDALLTALPAIGSGIIGSGMTTTVGFLALMLASMPMLRDLGFILALGIVCILFATIAIAPSFILVEERAITRIKKTQRDMLK